MHRRRFSTDEFVILGAIGTVLVLAGLSVVIAASGSDWRLAVGIFGMVLGTYGLLALFYPLPIPPHRNTWIDRAERRQATKDRADAGEAKKASPRTYSRSWWLTVWCAENLCATAL
jgi:hypothetical protein